MLGWPVALTNLARTEVDVGYLSNYCTLYIPATHKAIQHTNLHSLPNKHLMWLYKATINNIIHTHSACMYDVRMYS